VNKRRLPVRSCSVIGAGDVLETHHTVECPRRQRSIDFAQCCGCALLRSVEVAEDGKHGSVDCLVAEEGPPHGRVDVAEAAIRVRLGELMGAETTCVRADVRLAAISDLLATDKLRALPVVDEGRRLVGIVSKTDLLRAGGKRSKKRVGDIMTPLVHGLPEDAPVAYAISLMAFEGLHEVPVVDKYTHVIGMITSTDALRWVAGALGYVVPRPAVPDVLR
jgi:CBS-domain-containing membrane protein